MYYNTKVTHVDVDGGKIDIDFDDGHKEVRGEEYQKILAADGVYSTV